MERNTDKVIEYGKNGLQFESNGGSRPRVHDIGDGEFYVYDLVNGSAYLDKEDIDDLIILLQEVKAKSYKIDNWK